MSRATLHETLDGFSLQLVGDSDGRRLGHRWVRYQRAFHFRSADPVTGHVEHVVGPPEDGDVSIFVLHSHIPGDVGAWNQLPVALITRSISPNRAQHIGEWALENQASTNARRSGFAAFVNHIGFGARNRDTTLPRAHGIGWRRADRRAAKLSLPPVVND